MKVFCADVTVFLKISKRKNCPQLLIIPLDQQISVQQVFALCNRDSCIV